MLLQGKKDYSNQEYRTSLVGSGSERLKCTNESTNIFSQRAENQSNCRLKDISGICYYYVRSGLQVLHSSASVAELS